MHDVCILESGKVEREKENHIQEFEAGQIYGKRERKLLLFECVCVEREAEMIYCLQVPEIFYQTKSDNFFRHTFTEICIM